MKTAYPIILTPSEGGYLVYAPDFNINTEGRDLADATYHWPGGRRQNPPEQRRQSHPPLPFDKCALDAYNCGVEWIE